MKPLIEDPLLVLAYLLIGMAVAAVIARAVQWWSDRRDRRRIFNRIEPDRWYQVGRDVQSKHPQDAQ